jgi:hypothetical protein
MVHSNMTFDLHASDLSFTRTVQWSSKTARANVRDFALAA